MSQLLEIHGEVVRPRALHELPVGRTFLLHDIESGAFIVGSLVRVGPGYAKVSIVGEEREHSVPDKKRGGLRTFTSQESYQTEWSRSTMVYPVPLSEEVAKMDTVPVEINKKGQPVPPKVGPVGQKRSVLKPSNQVKDEPVTPVTKEQIMAKVEKAKAVAAAKGTSKALKSEPKEPKAPKVPTNICPGSGELVFRRFKPGMDARYYGWLKKIVRGQMKTAELQDFTKKHLYKVDKNLMVAVEKELVEHGVDVEALKEEAATE